MLREFLVKNRSYRRFDNSAVVNRQTLVDLVDLTRLAPSSANLQPLKYMLSCEAVRNSAIFPHLGWAGYLKDWPGPRENERPAAYIIILGDTGISRNFGPDMGIAAQTMLLGAIEKGLGGCIIANIAKNDLRRDLFIPERFDILAVLALGRPIETVRLETIGKDGDVKYWRDSEGIHHVPKRRLEDIIIEP